jgi:hypothetical protein
VCAAAVLQGDPLRCPMGEAWRMGLRGSTKILPKTSNNINALALSDYRKGYRWTTGMTTLGLGLGLGGPDAKTNNSKPEGRAEAHHWTRGRCVGGPKGGRRGGRGGRRGSDEPRGRPSSGPSAPGEGGPAAAQRPPATASPPLRRWPAAHTEAGAWPGTRWIPQGLHLPLAHR